jgi:hypothetical protein
MLNVKFEYSLQADQIVFNGLFNPALRIGFQPESPAGAATNRQIDARIANSHFSIVPLTRLHLLC